MMRDAYITEQTVNVNVSHGAMVWYGMLNYYAIMQLCSMLNTNTNTNTPPTKKRRHRNNKTQHK